MKKTQTIISLFAMVFVIGLIIFAGCSKNGDIQTVPKFHDKNSNIKELQCDNGKSYIPKLIKNISYEDLDENISILPEKVFFINLLISGINSGELEFINYHQGISFLNKLIAISTSYTLSNGKNVNGIKKILSYFTNNYGKIPETTNPIDKPIIYMILSITFESLNRNLPLATNISINSWQDVRDSVYIQETQGIEIIIVAVTIVATIVIGTAILIKGACEIKCIQCKEEAMQIEDPIKQNIALEDCYSKYKYCGCN